MTETPNSLDSLARRGRERGATAVLDGARHDARHHQRQRTVAVGATAVTLLAGTVGAGVLLLHDEPPPVASAASFGAPAAPGAPGLVDGPLVAGIRLVGHDGYDRIEIDYDGAVPPSPHPEGAAPEPTGPECATPADLEDDGISSGAVPSGAADTPDGLVAGLSGQRISGDTTYVGEVVPLCAQNGYTYFAVVIDDPSLMGQQVPSGPNGEVDRTGMLGQGECVLDEQIQLDFFVYPGPDATPPSDEVCSAPAA